MRGLRWMTRIRRRGRGVSLHVETRVWAPLHRCLVKIRQALLSAIEQPMSNQVSYEGGTGRIGDGDAVKKGSP
jgi:hypothetical protein